MIVFEDEYIVAVAKPTNMLVHHSFMARNKSEEKTLVALLQETYNLICYPIHRLDRKTSGIILFAKDRTQVAVFQELFQSDNIQKTYYGIVRGFSPTEGTIDSPVKGRDAKVYKDALTHYKTLSNVTLQIPVKPFAESRYSLIQLMPKTGRMHQLRIHMNKLSHPLIGDPKYGDRFHNRMFQEQYNSSDLYLHAHVLEFTHPFSNQNMVLKADFPKDWKLRALDFDWILPK